MPEKTLTVATYAAGASLAAITLVYVFGPTYFLDNNPSGSGSGIASFSNRKKGVVGLSNPANDCFINSVLQALAGLGDLRLYLIREIHRRSLDENWVYTAVVPQETKAADSAGAGSLPTWKVEGLQSGIVTKALKEILDSLNERPIYRKTINAGSFVRSLEIAFRQRISRQQQDAQEFLQVVAERLCDEYHAGCRARSHARRKAVAPDPSVISGARLISDALEYKLENPAQSDARNVDDAGTNSCALSALQKPSAEEREFDKCEEGGEDGGEGGDEEGFPMEGTFESQIECLTCGFKPRPTESTFCTLTLNVPQTSSTTLNACFDGMFKTEYIDDFKCEKCRLVHALALLEAEVQNTDLEASREKVITDIAKLQEAIDTDPEKPPTDIALPDLRHAPRRRIARHIRLTSFPKIMAIHLSRSIFDSSHLSQKNSAKVSFPEHLPLGGLLRQRKYKLLALVTHKGSHYSGHYESFRRQNFHPPFSNQNTFQPSGIYSSSASPASTPQITAVRQKPLDSSPIASTPDLLSSGSGTNSSARSIESAVPASPYSGDSVPPGDPMIRHQLPGPTSAPREKDGESSNLKSARVSARSTLSKITSLPSSRSGSRTGFRHLNSVPASGAGSSELTVDSNCPGQVPYAKPRRRKHGNRWWRISDEKIKEASTRDVLGMRREVYLLFYELERNEC